jgi:predicted transcriptional regulator of viral defense system
MLANDKQSATIETMERTLSQSEAKVILDLEWRNQKTLTLADLSQMVGASDSYARYMAHRLVKKGWLERLRPGLFQLVPANRGREGVPDSNALAVGTALVQPYFFSFGTACTHHGLTEQVFTEAYVACQERRRSLVVRSKRYVFVYVPKRLFFGFGEVHVLGHPVHMATVERALLDALDRPRFAGGIGEVSRIVARASTKVSWKELLRLARRTNRSALVQRLGYLLDLHQDELPPMVRRGLLKLVRPHNKIFLGPRKKWGTSGKLVTPWNVVENIPRSVLISAGEGRRQRVVFTRSKVRR